MPYLLISINKETDGQTDMFRSTFVPTFFYESGGCTKVFKDLGLIALFYVPSVALWCL